MTEPKNDRVLASRGARLSYLGLLYFVQGLPFGIQVGILPLLLAQRGASRTTIAYTSLLGLPYFLKAFVAPLVERRYVESIGRRRTWILAMQLVAFVTLIALSVAIGGDATVPLMVGVFVLYVAMSTMDISVDGLAVEILRDDELGPGNSAQVGGYKLGMLFASGGVLQVLRWFHWSAVMWVLAGIVLVAFVATLVVSEPYRASAVVETHTPKVSLVTHGKRLFATPASRWLVVLLLAYKAGESMADAQFRPFLHDGGLSDADIGLYAGVYGGFASVLGSIVGGTIAARSRSIVTALFVVAAIRVLPVAAETWLALSGPTELSVALVSLAEHLGGGMLTTVVFALMMSSTDRAHAGTSFTVLATIELIGKGTTGFLSGHVADHLGDAAVFGTATALSLAFVGLYFPMRREELAGAYRRELVS